MIFDLDQLLEFFHASKSTVTTNFPKFASNQAKKGYLITKQGIGKAATYEVEKIEPKYIDPSNFSNRKIEIAESLPGEIWKTTYCSDKHEVSNLGRIRKKDNKTLIKGSMTTDGYLKTEIVRGIPLRIHRIVMQTFNPIEDFESKVVDHINGVRTDNRLENLRWASPEENTLLMLKNREEITRETTRLINKYGYEKTLELIQAIP